MTTTESTDFVALGTAHTWVKHPCTCELSAGECRACQLDLATCSACGMNSDICTTHCSGEKVDRLVESVVHHAGLDFVNDTWTWRPQEMVAINEYGDLVIWQHAGSIDRLVAYAERRSTKPSAARWIARSEPQA